jgi:PAS domain S-box-containing protein
METESMDVEHLLFVLRDVDRERARLLTAAKLAGVGHWEWDVDRDQVTGSDQLCHLHGVAAGELDGSYGSFLDRLHADDRELTDGMLRAAVREHRGFAHHHRIVRSDGRIRMLYTQGEVSFDGRGRRGRVFAISSDVTEHESARRRTAILGRVGRFLLMQELEPALEAVAGAALPHLGQVCVVDKLAGDRAIRVLDLRIAAGLDVESAEELASVARAEIRDDGLQSRLTVPISAKEKRLGSLSFVKVTGRRSLAHDLEDLTLGEELARQVGMMMDSWDARRRMSEALADREQLLYIVGHELRGPLASLRLSIDAMARAGALEGAAARQLATVNRMERRLTRLIDELLDVGRIRSGQLVMALEPTDLAAVAREVVSRMKLEIERSGSAVSMEARGSVVGRWDGSRLDQVITNLLGNALKFGDGRPVEVRIWADDGHAYLSVVDHGPGIARELHEDIFLLFKRADAGQRLGGLGLGLHIARDIVERLGGKIGVESDVGTGATFTVELPL